MRPYLECGGVTLECGDSSPLSLAATPTRDRKRKRRQVAALPRRVALVAILAVAGAAWAQSGPPLQGPPVMRVDLTGANRERKTTFQADGLAMEVVGQLVMTGQTTVRIEASLPEPGEFKVESASPAAQVDVRNVRASGRQGTADVTARFTPMSVADAEHRAKQAVDRIWDPLEQKFRPEADQMDLKQLHAWLREKNIPIPEAKEPPRELELCRREYRTARVFEVIGPAVRERLNELMDRKSQWFNAQDRAAIDEKNSRTLVETYQEQAKYDIIDEYLRGVDLGVETHRANYRTRLTVRLEAAYQVLTGKGGRGTTVASGLTPAEQSRLRAALTVKLVCRFYPAADPQDPNAQWFNGQRTACRAKGVASIRLEGTLDPGKRDRVDWWLLEGYDPQTVRLDYPRNAAFRVDSPFMVGGGARLRVVAAGEKAVDYAVELRPVPASSGKLNVVIHESPSPSGRKFPY